jgi:hypothetical protein
VNKIRKPEYHLYLYSVPITYLLDFVEDMQLTVGLRFRDILYWYVCMLLLCGVRMDRCYMKGVKA